MDRPSELKILNLGAGYQSTALYLMSMRQDEPEHIPVFDYAIFADTQEEPRAVYEHLDWLQSLGGPPIIVASKGKLGDDLINGINSDGGELTRFASIPTYCIGEGDEREGRNRRQCTREYKIDVIERVIRRQILGLIPYQHFPKDVHVHQYIGLSLDEPDRIISVKARFQKVPWATPHFPLFFDLMMTRFDCENYLNEAAPGRRIVKSACVCCPYHNNAEWRRIRDTDPEGWARAIEIDEALRNGARAAEGMDRKMYLHRSCKPLREAPIDTPESRGDQYLFGFARECEGMCGL